MQREANEPATSKLSPTDSLLGYLPAQAAEARCPIFRLTSFINAFSVQLATYRCTHHDLDIRINTTRLDLECRARPVLCPTAKVSVRSYRFGVREPGPELFRVSQHNRNLSGYGKLANCWIAGQEAVRYALPRDALRPQDRLLLLLQPPAPAVFRQQRLPLPAKPYPYQWHGIAFLLPRRSALLADEMGLGKTIQTILSLRLLFHFGEITHALIVCPKPLVPNWAKEMLCWAPEIPFEIVAGDISLRQQMWSRAIPVKITNYEVVARDCTFLAEQNISFDLAILDEAQRIKNADSKTAQAVRLLSRNRSWALTGTPIENSLQDLFSIFEFIKPGWLRADIGPAHVRELVQDYLLRRTKDQVATDLPPKTYRDVLLPLGPHQELSYQQAEREGVIWIQQLGRQVTIKHMLALIQRLKQICNFDPATGESSKLEQLEADLQELAANAQKAIVFSQWVETLQRIADKFPSLKPVMFHGKMSSLQRMVSLRRFQEDSDCRLILMTYGSGGVGLNLQCANYVFLFDRWWNPAIEDQAINRAHRIGQTQPVIITRYMVQDTIETRIQEILEQKRLLFQQVIGQSADASIRTTLTMDDLYRLFDIAPSDPGPHQGC